MKRTRIIPVILFLLIVQLTAVPAAAATYYSDGNYTFEKTERNEAVIVNCALTEKNIEIPGDVLGYPVAGIGSYAFFNNGTVESVTLPGAVTSIGNYAFAKNSGLQSVTIPNSCESIAANAFFNSTNVVIKCCHGSAAETYAAAHNIPCVFLDDAVIGDVNGDGTISITDVTTIQRHIARIKTLEGQLLLAADTSSDGSIDVNDATALQRYIAGFYSPYHIGEPTGC